jgi:simple sugar transport system permease protein
MVALVLIGAVFALVHAVFSISLRADQIVSGFAINFLALGLTGYIFLYHYGERGTPDNLPQVPDVSLPITSIPFFGPALDNLNLLVWISLLLVLLVWLFVFRTPTGLRLRSVGENPRAAATVGISVYKVLTSDGASKESQTARRGKRQRKDRTFLVTPVVAPKGGGATLRLDW